MNRRDVITLLGGAAVGWPLAAHAQQPGRIRRIGVLMGIAESDPERQSFVSAFTRALADSGWREGSNIRIDYRWGAGDRDRIRGFARELVELQPDLIVGHTTPVVAALKQQRRGLSPSSSSRSPIRSAVASWPVSPSPAATSPASPTWSPR
jgi:putative tryptophan/tyrosine transport system substrate-binding protein